MSKLDVEKLKVIAEGMGYEKVVIAKDTKPHKVFKYLDDKSPTQFRRDEYNPENNPAQLVEIIEKLKIHSWWNNEEKIWKATIKLKFNYMGLGKTINEAVLQAAYEVFKVDNDIHKGNQ